MITLETAQGGLRLVTPYDVAFLAAFKATVPHQARTWQKPYWIVDPAYGGQVAALVQSYFGVALAKPAQAAHTATAEIRALEVQYVGRCKDRSDGAASAYGFVEGAWSVIFPEAVLRAWFKADEQKLGAPATLYSVLSIVQTASDDEIKRAYRRMARQWHPDVCKEPDATERFHAIRRAYELLSDPITHKKYDAALLFEAALADTSDRYSTPWDKPGPYRAPLRCGLLLCEGAYQIGRFVVSNILDWQDVVRDGKTMVSSWDTVTEQIKIAWV